MIGDTVHNFDQALIESIDYEGGQGDDILVNNTALPMVAYGFAGNDYIVGGPGADFIHGGPGEDLIYGNGGDDDINGHTGDDVLYGGDGNDYIQGGYDNDTIYAEAGNDTIGADWGDDLVYAGAAMTMSLVSAGTIRSMEVTASICCTVNMEWMKFEAMRGTTA